MNPYLGCYIAVGLFLAVAAVRDSRLEAHSDGERLAVMALITFLWPVLLIIGAAPRGPR